MTAKRFPRLIAPLDLLVASSLAAIAACTLTALSFAWRWPLVGDSALMRYVVFLLQRGFVPYAQVVDINMPGSYLLEAVAMRIFGTGATGLRLYDAALSAAICVAAVLLSRPELRARACALAGALLIVLIHLRDGVVQAGQRDYAILAIVLLACTLLLRAPLLGGWAFGFLAGCAVTIKPSMLPLILLPLAASFFERQHPRDAAKRFGSALAAFLLPLAAIVLWLHKRHAIPGFIRALDLVRRSHSILAHRTLGFLLIHSIQPATLLLIVGLALLALRAFRLDARQKLLLFAALVGLGSFVLQGKGFPYQRYPVLGLLVITCFSLLADELHGKPLHRTLAAAGLLLACFWSAPRFALTVARYDHTQPFEDALARELTALHAAHGEVQCLDTVGGCVNVLYDQQLVQSTGYLYDCYAYAGPADEQNAYRQSFLAALQAARPRYIVLTSEFCLNAQGRTDRTNEWPAMRNYLAQNYTPTAAWQSTQPLHWWHEPETPPSFRIFSHN